MRVPFVDLKVLYLDHKAEIDAALAGVLDSQGFIMGPEVTGLENEVASYLGDGVACVGVSSGTCALNLSLMALRMEPGDEVIAPAYSFIATANTISLNRCRPVFVDVEDDTLNLDCRLVEERLSERTRAIVPVHLFGRAADLSGLREVLEKAGRSDVVIIEDAAQAFGASLSGKMLGTIGRIGCFSFFPSKNLGGFGDGGMVASADAGLLELVRILRTHGGKDRYFNTELGINGRLDAVQAAILRTRLRHIDEWIQARRENAARYRTLFTEAGLLERVRMPAGDGKRRGTVGGSDDLPPRGKRGGSVGGADKGGECDVGRGDLPPCGEHGGSAGGAGEGGECAGGRGSDVHGQRFFHTYNSFNIRVDAAPRDELKAHLEAAGIGTAIYYPTPLPLQPCFADLGYQRGEFPVAEQACREILAIPVYPGLSASAQEVVVDSIRQFFQEH